MGSNNCMNEFCRGTASSELKKGWGLKSGGFATLCYNCGSAYENSVFCETFHSTECGWRDCRICKKRIHCGCIASRYLHEFMDFGGVGCISCVNRMEINSVQTNSVQTVQVPCDIPNGTFVTNGIRDVPPVVENKIQDDKFSTERLLQLTKAVGADDINSALEHPQRENFMFKTGESSRRFPNIPQPYSPSPFFKDKVKKQGIRSMYESPAQASLNYPLTTSFNNNSSPLLPLPVGVVEGGEQNKVSSQQGQRARQILPKPPKPSPVAGSETNKATSSQPRVARPPAEGRGRNQLLPRYWPRITDQELQQLSGDLKSTIVPLFEKILSASDAGRIGRLVLPKACAEAYFPAINQSEGIPIRIQDIKGKEWTFQFRFWPNNNSRMYVLEGVTPCIQNMQLEAGDTVTFSRIDPGAQLIIGCRKSTNNVDMQDSHAQNGDAAGETTFSGLTDNVLSKNGGRTSDDLQRHMTMSERKKARNIKNKRLLMHSDDARELRITWEEAQELLRPCPDSEPAVFMIEDQEFEEFEEPPVFGKRTIFTSRPSGEQEQLAQCDTCSKWRRLPVHALLSAKWTCSENIWDSNRSSCSAPEDINLSDLEFNLGTNKDFKQRRIMDDKMLREGEPWGLDALATAAVLGGDNITAEMGEVGATTRHPRHRPGCSCIVCIQPPSGKGKHEPTCKCNVCLTVKRRFKTLMMRKKKRQSEREAELAQEKAAKEGEDIAGLTLLNISNNAEDNEMNCNNNNNREEIDLEEAAGKGHPLDLNCDPLLSREDDILAGMSLTTLMSAATLPIDMVLEQSSEVSSLRPCLVSSSQNAGDGEKDGGVTSGNGEPENNNNRELG